MAKKLDKQQMGILIALVLAFVILIFYCVTMFGDDKPTAENKKESKTSMSFEASKSKEDKIKQEKDIYNDAVKLYEQEGEKTEEKKNNVKISFDGIMGKEKPKQQEVKPEVKPQVNQKQSKPASSNLTYSKPKEQNKPSVDILLKELPPKINEEVAMPKKRGLISATNPQGSEKGDPVKTTILVPAVVHGDQTLTTGRTIQLRLSNDCIVNGNKIPAGTIIAGTSKFENDRVDIAVGSIVFNGQILETNLVAFDKGIRGISAPGSTNKEIAADVANQGQGGGIRVTLPIIGGTISTDGSRKKINSKSQEVFIPSQYPLFLKYIEIYK